MAIELGYSQLIHHSWEDAVAANDYVESFAFLIQKIFLCLYPVVGPLRVPEALLLSHPVDQGILLGLQDVATPGFGPIFLLWRARLKHWRSPRM